MILVAAFLAASGVARAAETEPGSLWTTLFSSIEAETLSTFASTGAKRGVNLATDPQAIFISSSYGASLSDARRAFKSRLPSNQVDAQGRLMIGFERYFPQVFMSAALGPSMAQLKKLHSPGSEVKAGVVAQGDLWWRPANDRYLALSVTGDTAEQSLWVKARLGWRLLDLPFAIGPEASAGVGRNWSKLKAGMHIGDIRFWGLGFDASAGFMLDESNRSGAYASAALYFRY